MKGLLFTYALTYGGAVVSLFNPFYGLLIYICFAIIKPESLWHWVVPAGNYSRIVAIALLVGWAVNGFGNWSLGKAKLPVYCLIGFWCWAAVSGLGAEDSSLTLGFLESKGKIVLPVVVGATLIRNFAQVQQLAWVITLSMGYVAYDLNASYYAGFNRLEQYGFGGMDNNSVTIGLVACVPLAFFLGLATRPLWAKCVAFACSALMTHAVFFSFSRGGMVALVVAGVATFLMLPRTPIYYGLFGLGVVVALLMAGREVQEEFASSFADEEELDWAAESRVHLWGIALQMTANNPIFGVGPDHFPHHVYQYSIESNYKERFVQGKECHSLWMQQMAETGIPGVAFLVAFYGLTMSRVQSAARNMRNSGDSFVNNLPGMILPSLVAFAVAAQFVSLEGLEVPYYIGLLGVGAIIIVENQHRRSAKNSVPSVSHA